VGHIEGITILKGGGLVKLSILLAVLVLGVIPALAVADSGQDVVTMTKQELKEQLDRADLVILDVRTAVDWDSSTYKIKGAVREDPSGVKEWAPKYSKDKQLILYCA
jgi:hypothetical protein